MKDWISELQKMPLGEIRLNEPLSRHTSFRIGGPCDAMVLPDSTGQAAMAVAFARKRQIPVYILGGGTNVLVSDEGFRGLIVKLGGRLKQVNFNGTSFRAEAGLPLPALAKKAAEAGLGGLTFAAGIPGTVGGAVVMNAGAHGGCMADVITCIHYCDEAGRSQVMAANEAEFVYRASIFRHHPQWSILAIEGQLKPADKEALLAEMAAYSQERKSKQPQGMPCAGSFFKNPPGDSAGRLIESVGGKGWTVGGAMVSEKHGNFIVNTGAATYQDVLTLIKKIQDAVEDAYDIRLEREVISLDI